MSTHQQTFLVPMTDPNRPIYLDCAATTPIDQRVRDIVMHYMDVEFGNAGSRTHIYGQEAAKGVKKARAQIAAVVDASPAEIIFTSGATESNNLAILGLTEYGQREGKRHIISTQIEHKAVLEPLQHLAHRGFDIELVAPSRDGRISAESIKRRLRDDTLLVSVMHVNNEIGVTQPIDEIADALRKHSAILHVDAAQGFCKDSATLRNRRIDMISASGHKLYAPKGIGTLIMRRDRKVSRCVKPLLYGGGQERGLRSGTLATPLICGLGAAAEIALNEAPRWRVIWDKRRAELLDAFSATSPTIIGSSVHKLGNIISFALPGIDADALILTIKPYISISNTAACTSSRQDTSHVLDAIGLEADLKEQVCRASFCHLTPAIPVQEIKYALRQFTNQDHTHQAMSS